MPDSDNGDYLSDDEPGEIDAVDHTESISLPDGSLSQSPSSPGRSSRIPRKSADELVAGAEAISSDDDSEDGEIISAPVSPKEITLEEELQESPVKKEKPEPREDLEDGEIETDSEDDEKMEAEPLVVSPPAPMFPRNNNRAIRPKVEFPRTNQPNNNKRRRPEDCGVCKFYLRGTCTWNDKCKYDHPVGNQRLQWLSQLGLPDPEMGPIHSRRSSKPRADRSSSRSPRDKRSPPRFNRSKKQDGERSESKKSPRASPISSDGSRSPTPKRRRPSPTAVNVSSDEDSRPPSRSPSPRRRLRSTSSNSSRSRSTSPFNKTKADTTLGALLRKRRLESQQNSETQSSSFLPRDISDSDDEKALTPPPKTTRKTRVKNFFNRNSDDEPSVYKQSNKPPIASPTPQSISSSDDEQEIFDVSPRSRRSESPMLASA